MIRVGGLTLPIEFLRLLSEDHRSPRSLVLRDRQAARQPAPGSPKGTTMDNAGFIFNIEAS